MHCTTPTGIADSSVTVPAITLPPAPASTACAGTSAHWLPTAMVASSVVSKRTPSAVMHTVPFSIGHAAVTLSAAAKRRVPTAFSAAARVMPRVSA